MQEIELQMNNSENIQQLNSITDADCGAPRLHLQQTHCCTPFSSNYKQLKNMKQSIWKFTLEVEDYQKILMPKGARILSVQTQNNKPCIWAICNTETDEKEEHEFEIYGTGNPFYEGHHFGKGFRFIGTFQLMNGAFVGHLFELEEIQII